MNVTQQLLTIKVHLSSVDILHTSFFQYGQKLLELRQWISGHEAAKDDFDR